jgi:hypothetical protein
METGMAVETRFVVKVEAGMMIDLGKVVADLEMQKGSEKRMAVADLEKQKGLEKRMLVEMEMVVGVEMAAAGLERRVAEEETVVVVVLEILLV